jgi:hypothetical protein
MDEGKCKMDIYEVNPHSTSSILHIPFYIKRFSV